MSFFLISLSPVGALCDDGATTSDHKTADQPRDKQRARPFLLKNYFPDDVHWEVWAERKEGKF